MLLPRQKTPSLELDTLDHGPFSLSTDMAERGVVICYYRGLHCPICAKQLIDLQKHVDEFAKRGVACIAVSSDGRERTQQMADKVGAGNLQFGYGMSLAKAREWGLYISASKGKTSVGIEEPTLFSEPGLFLVSPDQSLYYGSVQTMPFARPHFSELLGALDFAIANDSPARGEYTGEV